MGYLEPLPLFARPKGATRQMARVQRQAQLKWPGAGIRLQSALRVSEEASVFRGYRGEDPVVVKKFWDLSARRGFVGGTTQALRRFERLGPHPDFSVNRCLASSGRLGLVVVSFEAGTPVDKLLNQPAANRAQILRQCCAWKSWAGQGEIIRTALPSNLIEAEIHTILGASARHPDAALLAELGNELLRMLPLLDGQPAARAPGHPDFAPRNLILRPDGGVAAVDIHRCGTFFQSRQAAIFLVSKDFQSESADGSLLFGLDQSEMLQFLAQSSVPKDETKTILIFFIGLTLLRMHSNKPRRGRGMKMRRLRIQAYLDDLRRGVRIGA